MPSKIAVALALLPMASAQVGLCLGDVDYSANAVTSCMVAFDELEAVTCPSSCSTGSGGVTGEGEGLMYTYNKGVGWCHSELDSTPGINSGVFDADTCWNACVDEFGAETIHNAEYDCRIYSMSYGGTGADCWCWCQDSCPCMTDVGGSSTLMGTGNELATESCGTYYADATPTDDYLNSEVHWCDCSDVATDEATCTDMLGADSYAWQATTCEKIDSVVNEPYSSCAYGLFDGAESVIEACCTTGLNGCTGVCYSDASTVTAMTGANPQAHAAPITSINAGDKVLAATHTGEQLYDEVEAVLHGRHAEDFVELKLAGNKAVRVTPHHTFPACSHKNMEVTTVMAKKVAAGDCIMTTSGKAKVESVKTVPAAKGEEAYTLVLKGKTDLIAVDGVFTHAVPEHKASAIDAKKVHSQQLRGAALAQINARKAKAPESMFSKHVKEAVDERLKAVAKKAKAAKEAKA